MIEAKGRKLLKAILYALLALGGIAALLIGFLVLQEIDMPAISRVYKAKQDIRVLSLAIANFEKDHEHPPAALTELVGHYLRGVPNDSWGRPYRYSVNAAGDGFELSSLGSDGILGGRGECTDISASTTDFDEIVRQIHWGQC